MAHLIVTYSNGKTPGITLPSADGQEAVIRKAYAKAGLPFLQTGYVECHGTGTKVGDVIEGMYFATAQHFRRLRALEVRILFFRKVCLLI